MRLQILLHDKTAHGVTDNHRRGGQAVGNHADVLDEVGDRTGAQRFVSRAVAMAAKAERQSAITLVGEEAQESFHPNTMPHARPRGRRAAGQGEIH